LNIKYGHTSGNIALKATSGVLLKVLRIVGEESSVVVDIQTEADALEFFLMIRTTIKDLTITQAYSWTTDRVTVSIGLASQIPKQDDSPESFRRAHLQSEK
jgi:GGDEF domain-containing protein